MTNEKRVLWEIDDRNGWVTFFIEKETEEDIETKEVAGAYLEDIIDDYIEQREDEWVS